MCEANTPTHEPESMSIFPVPEHLLANATPADMAILAYYAWEETQEARVPKNICLCAICEGYCQNDGENLPDNTPLSMYSPIQDLCRCDPDKVREAWGINEEYSSK